MQKIKVGYLVAFNNLPDAVWFEVMKIDGFELTVREEKTDNATQKIDKSLVKACAAPRIPASRIGAVKLETANGQEA